MLEECRNDGYHCTLLEEAHRQTSVDISIVFYKAIGLCPDMCVMSIHIFCSQVRRIGQPVWRQDTHREGNLSACPLLQIKVKAGVVGVPAKSGQYCTNYTAWQVRTGWLQGTESGREPHSMSYRVVPSWEWMRFAFLPFCHS